MGGPCASKADCGNGGLCDESFAGGYCYKNCPGGDSECPAGSACFGTGQSAACLLTCPNAGVGRDTCRADYVCVSTSRASLAVCLQACKSNADCDAGQSCDGKGYCK